jgi:ubiquitin C-terminal hydrolase
MLRFTRLDEHGQKVTTQVQLDPGLTFTSTESAKLEYSLYGVVEHVSTGNEEGHYVAYVKVRRPHLRQYVCKRLDHRYNHRRSTVRGTR